MNSLSCLCVMTCLLILINPHNVIFKRHFLYNWKKSPCEQNHFHQCIKFYYSPLTKLSKIIQVYLITVNCNH